MHFSANSLYFTVLTLSSTSAVLAAVSPYGQCGGQSYTGETTCEYGWKCTAYNPYYSQCVKDDSAGSSVAPASSTAVASSKTSTAAPTTLVTATSITKEATTSTPAIVVTTSSSLSVAPTSTAGAGNGTGANGADCSIDAKFKAHANKLYIGVATDRGLLADATNAQIIIDDFGQVTPENSMKWDATEPTQNTFNFAASDALVTWATTNKKIIRGHTTVWHSQLPSWVSSITDKDTLTAVMKNHINKLLGQYKGKIYAWDVVNEILAEDGTFRSSVFYNVLGEDFVKIAFETARAADPAAKLYINDYNLDSPGYAKTTSMISKVTAWKAAGVPIDGIGSQSHLNSQYWPVSDNAAALKKICAVVDECAITELDIAGGSASEYATAVKGCVDVANCVGITVWGVSDKDSWRASTTPLLFDASFQAKEAYNAVCAIL
ncbi:glycoside hydrolase family 10 protein [Lentithecium fluviatile CBS 122367]|uniref:Beta-xylanase n=1 Tax=Lentithecium fluviatile CBS 122367 TaxID=1168545 RepID=A0A6G1IRU9_9PLEO|nr:glycoside hydrolase family 10 protein [Lentithecium fluviatile CBS 122367]